MIYKKYFLPLIVLFFVNCTTTQKMNYYGLDEAIHEAAIDIAYNIPQGSKIAVLKMNTDLVNLSNYIIEELSLTLAKEKRLILLERKDLDIIENEINFQYSGEVDDDSLISIGHKLGAEYLVTGSFVNSGTYYRLMVNAINVKTAAKEAPVSLPVSKNDKQVSFFISGNNTQKPIIQENNINGTSWTTFYVDEDEFDEMFILVFVGRNKIRVDEIEYEVPDELRYTLPFSSVYDAGSWSQTGKNVNVKFNESIWDRNFNLVNEVFWELKLAIIDEKTMEGTILNNGELIGKTELQKIMK
jgi:TolB-like protein